MKKSNFEVSFFLHRNIQLFNGACYNGRNWHVSVTFCCVNINTQWHLAKKIKFSLKFCIQIGSWNEYFISCLGTKTGLCHLWRSCWRRLVKWYHGLTAANKFACLFCVNHLLRKYPEHTIPFIWFSDDKCLLFLCQWTFRMITELLCCKLYISSDVFWMLIKLT